MKQYPIISKDVQDVNVYAFDKLDGSNIRAEWSRKRNFYKFGTRHRLLGDDEPILGKSIALIKGNYEPQLTTIFRKQGFENVVCFFEFFGPKSFAGWHDVQDEHQVVLFDVNVFKRGLVSPADFLKLVGHLDVPQVLYYGKPNVPFVESVRDGSLPNMTFEGVVCKAPSVSKDPTPIMFKVKSRAWLDKLRTICKDDVEYELLA